VTASSAAAPSPAAASLSADAASSTKSRRRRPSSWSPCNFSHALQPPDSLPATLQQPRGQRGKGRVEPPGERGELRFSAPSRPTAPEGAFCNSSLPRAVLRARLVGLRQKTAPAPEPELYQTDPKIVAPSSPN
jgi:hypothetical protein